MKSTPLSLAVSAMGILSLPAALNTGDIAFVGFNADGDEDFAIVALTDLGPGEVIYFRDEEWDGAAFATGESEIEWTIDSLISAGTVVTFNSVGTGIGSVTASHGLLAYTLGTTMSISSSAETIWAYQGTSNTPTTFLAAIANNSEEFSGPLGTLSATGLAVGQTAVLLPNDPVFGETPDGAQYIGTRSLIEGSAYSDFIDLIGDANANWAIDLSLGTNFLPFDTTHFTIPESGTGLLALAAGVALAARRRRPVAPLEKRSEDLGVR